MPDSIAASLRAVVLRLLAKSRKDRYDTAEATMAALAAAQAELDAIPAPPVSAPIPAGTVVAAAVPSVGAVMAPTRPVARRPNTRGYWVAAALLLVGLPLVIAIGLRMSDGASSSPDAADTVDPMRPSVGARAGAPGEAVLRACRGKDCKCRGAQSCGIECVEDCKLSCTGPGDCTFVCGEGCRVRCKGSGTCVVEVGHDSDVTCTGSGRCEVTCHGACELSCRGDGPCGLRCMGDAPPDPEVCDEHTLACGSCD